MIMVIIMAIKTIGMTKKIRRIQKHLDLKETREKQEDDDQLCKDKIAAGCEVIHRPNPRRNYEQMNKYKVDLQEKLTRVEQEQKHQDRKQEQTINHLNVCIQSLNRKQEGKASESISLLCQS